MEKNKIFFIIDSDNQGLRLDKAAGSQTKIGSRSRAEQLIAQGRILVNGKAEKSSYKTKLGDNIEISLPNPEPTELVPLDRPLDLLFEDSDLIVLNKPAGLVVHPAAGHAQDTLVNMLVAHTDDLSMGFQENRPGIVHRLDRDTSGVLVVAKNDFTHQALSEMFQKRDIHRVYHAICVGLPPTREGTIRSYLGRHPTDRKRFASRLNIQKQIERTPHIELEGCKWAVTHFRVLDQTHSGLSYLELKLETGRTHQIRVHLSEMGCPIVHDELYGALKKKMSPQNQQHREIIKNFPRFALHARELGFKHPRTGQELSFRTNWPDDLLPLIEKLGFSKLPDILRT